MQPLPRTCGDALPPCDVDVNWGAALDRQVQVPTAQQPPSRHIGQPQHGRLPLVRLSAPGVPHPSTHRGSETCSSLSRPESDEAGTTYDTRAWPTRASGKVHRGKGTSRSRLLL